MMAKKDKNNPTIEHLVANPRKPSDINAKKRADRFQQFKQLRRKKILSKDIEKILKRRFKGDVEKLGAKSYRLVLDTGVILKGNSKKAVLNDAATVLGYTVDG